ncbi:uncharacterized protein BDZ99DRAFT_574397 [Mytilinidion resinicola]|uniref:Rhodopsin domain-containing protein n=1 Tax=Mytilinidion resinicola TaxID=574789 RepID=A0A6A6YA82_9PEZI|nr:uncharacterized protein BDZ99DRAFT_574397 [Mytilinidion resinicola]KAF2805468.1 hypothetical protein BDZ99DRAFT_574397 [Mytilinidion resinicola]
MPFSFAENPQGTIYFSICCFFQVLSFAATGLRLWGRKLQRIPLQVNDYAILAALALTVANIGVLGASVRHGMGVNIAKVGPEDLVTFVKLQTVITVTWEWAIFAIRISILDLYIKIFRIPWFIKVCYAYLAFQVAFILSMFLTTMLLCRPFRYQWDKTVPGGVCGDLIASYYATHITILLTDVITAVLPIPVLWKLNMNTRKKIGISLMFMLGTVIVTFNIIRLAWTDKVKSPDITYAYAILFCFSELEIQLGLILASVPLMQPVLHKYLGVGFPGKSPTARSHNKSGASTNPIQLGTIGSTRTRKYNNILETESAREFDLDEEDEGDAESASRISPNLGKISVTLDWEIRHETGPGQEKMTR